MIEDSMQMKNFTTRLPIWVIDLFSEVAKERHVPKNRILEEIALTIKKQRLKESLKKSAIENYVSDQEMSFKYLEKQFLSISENDA